MNELDIVKVLFHFEVHLRAVLVRPTVRVAHRPWPPEFVFFVVPLNNGRTSRREERYLVLDDVGRESSWGHTEEL